jgi:hypothetical protein
MRKIPVAIPEVLAISLFVRMIIVSLRESGAT